MIPDCMGGWCTRRDKCRRFSTGAEHKVERLCQPGQFDEFAPHRVTAIKSPRKMWTDDEKAMLVVHYPTMPTTDLAAQMDRTVGQLQQQASRMGLKKLERGPDLNGPNGRPPVRRQAVLDQLAAVGVEGLTASEVAAQHPDVSINAVKMAIYKLCEAGLAFSLRRYGATRYFAAAVPRKAAEELQLQRAKARMAESIRAVELAREAKLEARKARRKAVRKAKEQASERRREASAGIANAIAQRLVRQRTTVEQTQPKVQQMPEPDMSRAKLTICPPAPDRWAVEPPRAGGFASLRPGQYAFEARSCAAKELA